MLTDFETFKRHSWILAIKFLEIKHQKNTPYPYLIYSYIGETQKWASNKFIVSKGLYQVSLLQKELNKI